MGCQQTKDKRSNVPLVYEVQPATHRSSSRSPQRTPRSARSRTPRDGRTPRSRSRTPREGRTPRDVEEGGFHPRELIPKVPYEEVEFELAYFEKLPGAGIKRNVFSAYDGDGLTLRGEDNAKVRYLAIDTPEVQLNEPYAEEARVFNHKLCVGKDVYLIFDAEREDRYGRLLPVVFVKDLSHPPNKFFCINVALLEAGLATYYHPQHSELALDDLLLKAQQKARAAKLNIWHDVNEEMIVYLTANGKAFHMKTCTSIEHSPLTSTTIREALDDGRNPCRDCHPQWSEKPTKDEKQDQEAVVANDSIPNGIKEEEEDTPSDRSAKKDGRKEARQATPAEEDM